MFSPHDKLYKETKQIRLGRKALKPTYVEIIQWAKKELGLTILNISYHKVKVGKTETRPGIKFILESPTDIKKVLEPQSGREMKEVQQLLRSKFVEIIQGKGITGYEQDNLKKSIISYAVFSGVVVTECVQKIARESILHLEEKYRNENLRKILRNQGTVILFFEKEAHIKLNREKGVTAQIASEMVDLASQNDEFGYVNRNSVSIEVDSMENVKNQFGGKWHNYFK